LGVARYRSLPPTGGRLPATIQEIQRSQGYAPGTPSWLRNVRFVFRVAIPLSLARQERRANAFVAGPSGLPYLLPPNRMDAIKKQVRRFLSVYDAIAQHARRFFLTAWVHQPLYTIKKRTHQFCTVAYTQPQSRPNYRREVFHLGWTFDAAVIVALLIAVVGYITA